ncbi:hypothetical protein BDW68DRAFT_167051 [Aspergillus falconensis]
MTKRATNPQSDWFNAPIPPFAIQVYSTIPLGNEHTELCTYLTRGLDTWPTVSFEIYSAQPDVWACIEHQRREIFHRKRVRPGEDFFPGIAKAMPNQYEKKFQGFLLVITSHSYRGVFTKEPEHEAETGPLWVTFNRSLPAHVSVHDHDQLEDLPEGEEIVVTKCRNTLQMSRDLGGHGVFGRSEVEEGVFDYGLDEDEGDPSSLEQPPAPEIIELVRRKADSLPHNDFSVQTPSQGVAVVTSNPAAPGPGPDLQYIIHITFPHPGLELTTIARAFTAALIEHLTHAPKPMTVNLIFHTAPPSPRSFGSILESHRTLMASRAVMSMGVGRLSSAKWASEAGARIFPQSRIQESEEWSPDRWREPYRTFFVVLDRADFLTGPGVLFFLTDGNELTDECFRALDIGPDSPADTVDYVVWRSRGMPEVARRLAMLVVSGKEIDADQSLG